MDTPSSSPATRHDGRNAGLDFIRATAITLVLVTHYSKVSPVCGVLGVELFFVLSGFLIGGILYRTIQFQESFDFVDLKRFWTRRWLRTLPNYFLFLGIFALYNNTMTDRLVQWKDVWRYFFFLQNFAWPVPAFYGISWSLAVEEWFYFLFPAGFYLAYLLMGKNKLRRRMAFLISIAFFSSFSIILRFLEGTSAGWHLGMRTIVVYRLDALMFGVILAVARQDCNLVWRKLEKCYFLGVILLIVGAAFASGAPSGAVPIIPAAGLLLIIPAAFALILPWATSWRASPALWSRAVRGISRYSYSMYLCHWPILWLVMQAADDPRLGLTGKLLVRLSAAAGTIVCSGLLYRCLEQPILRLASADRYSPLGREGRLAPSIPAPVAHSGSRL